jgi:hypothetical protein
MNNLSIPEVDIAINGNYFLYLVIGNDRLLHQELYCSLLSLQSIEVEKDFEVVIYSDGHVIIEESFFDFTIRIKLISQVQISNWTSESKLLLALKPIVIKDFFSNHKGNVIYLDVDTFFIKDPSRLFNEIDKGNVVMHLRENILKRRKDYYDYISNNQFNLSDGSKYTIDTRTEMWNSGVVGISDINTGLIDEIIILIDQIRRDKKWHTIEQFSISYFFQKNKKLISADEYIFHYWFYHPIRYLLSSYFDISTPEEEALIQNAIQDGVVDKNIEYEMLPFYAVNFFVNYSEVFDWHFVNMPKNTSMGKLLRRVFIKDFKSLIFVWSAALKSKLSLSSIREISKAQYEYE